MVPDRRSTILTINSGSSSIKFALFQLGTTEELVLSGRVDRLGLPGGVFQVQKSDGEMLVDQSLEFANHAAAFEILFAWLRSRTESQGLTAIGHRIVHGGARHVHPEAVTSELVTSLRDLIPLAPNHLPHEIEAIEAVERSFPEILQVACFDTAFHRRMPLVAQTYALPRQLRKEGVMRYGFHGLSYEYILSELERTAPEKAAGRVIIAHLGNGASMAAVRQRIGVETTMGFTPTGGLVMSTRSGDLDPGVIVHLLASQGLNAGELNALVNQRAGLLGVSGLSSDVKDLLEQEAANPAAAEALDLFCYQAKKYLGALAAVLGGLDELIFTAGIGERAPAIRGRICDGLTFLGIDLDCELNDRNASIISADGGRVTVRVMKTNEELMIARHAYHVLCRSSH